MTSPLIRGSKFLDIGSEMVSMVTDYLPDEEKIQLVDTIPETRNQVKLFTMTNAHKQDHDGAIELMSKLKNVSILVNQDSEVKNLTAYSFWGNPVDRRTKSEPGTQELMRKLAAVNPNIVKFQDYAADSVIAYIGRVKELNSDYDASNVTEMFNSMMAYNSFITFLAKYPDMKIKLCTDSISGIHFAGNFMKWHHLFKHLDTNSMRHQLSNPFPFVETLTFGGHSAAFINSLPGNLKFLPNLTGVELKSRSANVPLLVSCLMDIDNLVSLKLDLSLKVDDIDSIQLLLAKPSLQEVEVASDDRKMWAEAFVSCPRNDLTKFSIQGWGQGNWENLNIAKKWMTFKTLFDIPLSVWISKFKRIKGITVEKMGSVRRVQNVDGESEAEKFKREIKEQFDVIVANLPRNRALQLEFKY